MRTSLHREHRASSELKDDVIPTEYRNNTLNQEHVGSIHSTQILFHMHTHTHTHTHWSRNIVTGGHLQTTLKRLGSVLISQEGWKSDINFLKPLEAPMLWIYILALCIYTVTVVQTYSHAFHSVLWLKTSLVNLKFNVSSKNVEQFNLS